MYNIGLFCFAFQAAEKNKSSTSVSTAPTPAASTPSASAAVAEPPAKEEYTECRLQVRVCFVSGEYLL